MLIFYLPYSISQIYMDYFVITFTWVCVNLFKFWSSDKFVFVWYVKLEFKYINLGIKWVRLKSEYVEDTD